MYMTEEEAREKWCSEYRAFSGDDEGGGDNRPLEHKKITDDSLRGHRWEPTGRLHPDCCCIASRCAKWRWGSAELSGKPTIHELEEILDGPDGHVEIKPDGSVTTRIQGYCGLAGKPE